jgi:hypothetical protein
MSDNTRPIRAQDDLPHDPEGADDWRENWWLCFFDEARGLRGIVYGGVQPLMRKGFVLLGLFRDDRPLYVLDKDDLGEGDYDHAFGKVGPLTFTCDEPMNRWTVGFDTVAASGELEWTAAHAAYDWAWGHNTGSRHYEQPGRVTGRMTVGDETFEIDGWGQRDRAWGHRPNSAIRTAWSSRVLFGEDDFQHASAISVGGHTYLFGYRIRDGKAMLIDRLRLSPSYAYPGGPPLSTELLAWSGDERVADQQVRLSNVIPRFTVAKRVETHQFFTFSRWEDEARSCAGQLDCWWSTPREDGGVVDISGNNGTWVQG